MTKPARRRAIAAVPMRRRCRGAARSSSPRRGVFYAEERAIALELLVERLRLGAKSGYSFFFAERRGELVGYCAWGAVPLTARSFDLYWIAVTPAAQGLGVGRELIAARRAGRGTQGRRQSVHRNVVAPRLRPHAALLSRRRLPAGRAAAGFLRAGRS